MKESYMKGIANHHGPESCLDLQQWGGEALTGEHTGGPLSSEITSIRRLTLLNEGESNTVHTIKARYERLRRSQRNQLSAINVKHWLEAGSILGLYHDRGTDELTNRAIKTFAHEQLPFKRFDANAAWYYMMLLGNNLFEAFKEDVTEAIIPVSVYADTFRRKFIDTAGKLVFHSGKLVMKVPMVDFVRLQLERLFLRLQVGLPQLC
jgi:hypothetical protein